MAKAIASDKNKPEQDDRQKTRKKQAKKEAKLMLHVEQAKKDVHKAEQKANKAQTTLQEQQARLQKFEEELNQFRNPGQEATTEVHAEAEPAPGISQSPTPDSSQTLSVLPVEDRSNMDIPEIQPSSSPAEVRGDIVQENATSVGITNMPIESIPIEQSDETAGAQVHADISINPAPTEEDLTINSGDGSIPVVTTDESAWPPPQIREEIAESVEEEVAQEHASGNNEQHEAKESDAEEETENHEAEHEASSSHPRRSTRRRTRSSAQQDIHKADQE